MCLDAPLRVGMLRLHGVHLPRACENAHETHELSRDELAQCDSDEVQREAEEDRTRRVLLLSVGGDRAACVRAREEGRSGMGDVCVRACALCTCVCVRAGA